jgi:hypothetical protein
VAGPDRQDGVHRAIRLLRPVTFDQLETVGQPALRCPGSRMLQSVAVAVDARSAGSGGQLQAGQQQLGPAAADVEYVPGVLDRERGQSSCAFPGERRVEEQVLVHRWQVCTHRRHSAPGLPARTRRFPWAGRYGRLDTTASRAIVTSESWAALKGSSSSTPASTARCSMSARAVKAAPLPPHEPASPPRVRAQSLDPAATRESLGFVRTGQVIDDDEDVLSLDLDPPGHTI